MRNLNVLIHVVYLQSIKYSILTYDSLVYLLEKFDVFEVIL
jgi:hypothetical protein